MRQVVVTETRSGALGSDDVKNPIRGVGPREYAMWRKRLAADILALQQAMQRQHSHPAAHRSWQEASHMLQPGQAEVLEKSDNIDPFVEQRIAATNGLMYRSIIGNLKEYPIPTLRMPPASSNQEHFLDLGCNWGRWCIAAHRLGYRPVGVDPSLDAIRAAYRVARKLHAEARYVVADVCYLPFRSNLFPVVFSYSVIQHFDKADAALALGEAARVLRMGGTAVIQMPHAFGIRNLFNQVRRGFRRPQKFEVRDWSPAELRSTFTRLLGPVELSVDGYFRGCPESNI